MSWPFLLGLARGRSDAHLALAELRAAAMRRRRPFWLIAALAMITLRAEMLGWQILLPWFSATVGIETLILAGGSRRTAPPSTWRDPDVLGACSCGRLGGDEFAVVVTDATDRERIDQLAIGIVEMLGAPFDIDGHILNIGGSVGSAKPDVRPDGKATPHDDEARNFPAAQRGIVTP